MNISVPRPAGEGRRLNITDLPPGPIEIYGLEGRLAQVFVNLISNAISFCEEGDAIRVWARKRENRLLVVVEDTGPGIPEEGAGQDLSAVLFGAARRPVRQQFRPGPGDLQNRSSRPMAA